MKSFQQFITEENTNKDKLQLAIRKQYKKTTNKASDKTSWSVVDGKFGSAVYATLDTSGKGDAGEFELLLDPFGKNAKELEADLKKAGLEVQYQPISKSILVRSSVPIPADGNVTNMVKQIDQIVSKVKKVYG